MSKKGALGNPIIKSKIDFLFRSDYYEIKSWALDFADDKAPITGFNPNFCIVYVKKGHYLFDYSLHSYDLNSGFFTIEKPNYEYGVRPAEGEHTIFNFTDTFYKQCFEDLNIKNNIFFSNENILSLTLKANAEMEYLHHCIVHEWQNLGKIEMDSLVINLFELIVATIGNQIFETIDLSLSAKHHLQTIERAKEYIHLNFQDDISLFEIAEYCHISPFHFSRIFKKFTSSTPIQYLQTTRLKYAEIQIDTTQLPISDIAYNSGFSSVEYFATVFKQKYRVSPSNFRK